jgi:hypothetical protein
MASPMSLRCRKITGRFRLERATMANGRHWDRTHYTSNMLVFFLVDFSARVSILRCNGCVVLKEGGLHSARTTFSREATNTKSRKHMKNPKQLKPTNASESAKTNQRKVSPKGVTVAAVTIFLAALTNRADVPQPVLKITSLGSNQFAVAITNGVTNANYELYWTPSLVNSNYPWQLLMVGGTGQTNFTVEVDAESRPVGFFLSGVGLDWDADGIENFRDANPYNASIGILTITIDSPLNGALLQ